ncbi:hypothetical protein LCGC14_2607950, partial [marine sediment metagenome]
MDDLNTKKFTVCVLQADIRIASADEIFVLQVKKNGKWIDKYHYS